MSHLTVQDIKFITDEISKSKILSNELRDDLIDHFCCVIEDELRKGESFQTAYNKAYYNISPN